MPAKVGSRFARECILFVHAWMYLPSWNCVMYDQTQVVANAACRVGS